MIYGNSLQIIIQYASWQALWHAIFIITYLAVDLVAMLLYVHCRLSREMLHLLAYKELHLDTGWAFLGIVST